MDVEEITKYACANPDNIDEETSVQPEEPVFVPGYDKGTHIPSAYIKTMEIYTENIDKDNTKTRRKTYII